MAFSDETPNPELLKLTQDAARYQKVRRMDVREFQRLSNDSLSYAEFDAKVDAHEAV